MKLISNPDLFLTDMVRNKTGISLSNLNKNSIQDITKKNASDSKNLNLDLSHINFFKKIPFIIHSGEIESAGLNQLIPWIEIFTRANVNFVILVRNLPLFQKLIKLYPWLSIGFVKRGVDVEEAIKLLPDALNVFYPSSTGNNIHIVRFNHLNHIFIGHGDSDKQSSAHKALRLYDEIWTAGQAHIDRFKKSNFNTQHIKFLKVGRPTLQKVINNCNESQSISDHILYLPTWEGVIEETNYSSTHISGQIIREVSKLISSKITIKFHPFTGNRNKALFNVGENIKNIGIEESLPIELLSENCEIGSVIPFNNLFICDISGVVTECLSANRPIFVYIPLDKTISIAESEMSYSDYCYTYSSVKELTEKLIDVMSGNDYLAENRKNAIDYFIGYNETIENRFIQQLNSLSNNNQPRYIPRLFQEL